MQILLVEDVASTRRVLRSTLEDEGHDVHAAATGAKALEHLESASVDVVVLDYELPDLDGLAVLQDVKSLRPEAAVVFLTGEGDEQVARKALSRGAVDYLVKDPDVYPELPRILERTWRKWGGLEQLVQLDDPIRERNERPPEQREAPSGLDALIDRTPIEAIIAFDGQGTVHLSTQPEEGFEAGLLATRGAALGHQAAALADAAGTEEDGSIAFVRGTDSVLALCTAPGRLRILCRLSGGTSPREAVDLVGRAARLAREVIDVDEGPDGV